MGRRFERAIAISLLTLVTACARAKPAANANSVSKTLEATDGSHAPLYPVLSEKELYAIHMRAYAAAPGWTINIDCLGRLAFAICEMCTSRNRSPVGSGFSRADHDLVETFLHDEEEIVHFKSPFVTLHKENVTGGALFDQETPVGKTGVVAARFGPFSEKVHVFGSAWPRLPPLTGGMSDAELEAKLDAIVPQRGPDSSTPELGPAPNLTTATHFVPVARSHDGPVELHRALCLVDEADRAWGCVDAFTGEDLAPLGVRIGTALRLEPTTWPKSLPRRNRPAPSSIP